MTLLFCSFRMLTPCYLCTTPYCLLKSSFSWIPDYLASSNDMSMLMLPPSAKGVGSSLLVA